MTAWDWALLACLWSFVGFSLFIMLTLRPTRAMTFAVFVSGVLYVYSLLMVATQ